MSHGGVSLVSRASGVSRVTVTAGVAELEAGLESSPGRVRRAGGGRKPLTEKDPGLLDALDALVEPHTRGDPMTRFAVDHQVDASAGYRTESSRPPSVPLHRRAAGRSLGRGRAPAAGRHGAPGRVRVHAQLSPLAAGRSAWEQGQRHPRHQRGHPPRRAGAPPCGGRRPSPRPWPGPTRTRYVEDTLQPSTSPPPRRTAAGQHARPSPPDDPGGLFVRCPGVVVRGGRGGWFGAGRGVGRSSGRPGGSG